MGAYFFRRVPPQWVWGEGKDEKGKEEQDRAKRDDSSKKKQKRVGAEKGQSNCFRPLVRRWGSGGGF